MKFRKTIEVEAHRWFLNGDHPHDRVGEMVEDPLAGTSYKRLEGRVVRFFRHPNVAGDKVHDVCGHPFDNHGWIDTPFGGVTVCPGDWIVTSQGEWPVPVKPADFALIYEPVVERAAEAGGECAECGEPFEIGQEMRPAYRAGQQTAWAHHPQC